MNTQVKKAGLNKDYVTFMAQEIDAFAQHVSTTVIESRDLSVVFPLYLTLKGMESVIREVTTQAMTKCEQLDREE